MEFLRPQSYGNSCMRNSIICDNMNLVGTQ